MTRHQHYAEQTQWWIDAITERAGMTVRFSPNLRIRFALAELAEQLRNLAIERRRHERADAEHAPRHARRVTEIRQEVEALRRFIAVARTWQL